MIMSKELSRKLKTLHRKEQEQQAERQAKKFDLPYVNLLTLPIDPEALALIPEKQARKYNLAVIAKINKKLKIAVLDPATSKPALNKLKNFDIKIFIVSKNSLNKAFSLYQEIPKPAQKPEIKISSKNLKKFPIKFQATDTTNLINIIIAGALHDKASDIHLEPSQDKLRLRYRIDGVLTDIANLDKKLYKAILSRIKLLSNLKLNIAKTPQDGRFTIDYKEPIDVRVSTLPGNYGESIVMRILNPELVILDLAKLGLEKDHLEILKKQISKPNGMILVTGPTGSGKTTTLYACLMALHKPGIKIITLEDPIEYRLKGISQTQIDEKKGYTFAAGLRSALRQDPDVILLGEIRDLKTAETALHAALTGHIVFSTLHTNDAAGAIPRLIDMGAKPFVVPPAINLVIAQRLVKKIDGGRIGVFELFEIDKEIEELIFTSPPAYKIKELAIKKGMRTMHEDGMLKVKKGIITLNNLQTTCYKT